MANHITTIKSWLKTKYSIGVPDDWVTACMEWILEENPNIQHQLDALKNQVYEQWLLTDLRDLNYSCLPETVKERRTELIGTFALQIDSSVDVGRSFYSQMLKVKGTDNPNTHVSGEDPKQPAWVPKPTLMIILNLTDGIKEVQGMEYQPIAALKPFMTPGTKILVKGPVMCRLGMLMLTPQNIQILGGEVDSIIESNTVETVLESAMKESVENERRSERQEFSGRMLSTRDDKKMVKKKVIKRENIKVETVSQNYTRSTQRVQHERQSTTQNIKCSARQEDEWEEDFDYEALMADMDSDACRASRVVKKEARSQHQVVNAIDSNADDFDDDFDMDTSISKFNQLSHKKSFKAKNTVYNVTQGRDKQNQNSGQSSAKPSTHISSNLQIQGRNEPTRKVIHGQSGNNVKIWRDGKSYDLRSDDNVSPVQDNGLDNDFDNDFEFEQNYSTSVQYDSKTSSLNVNLSDDKQLKTAPSSTKTVLPARSKQITPLTALKTFVPQAVIHPYTNPSSDLNVDRCSSNQSTMDSVYGPGSSVVSRQESADVYRFTYLNKILSTLPVNTEKEFLIKGYISTLTGKLTCCQGKKWCITCKINDGTAVVEVTLSNGVLTKLIGFSAQESLVMKQRSKQDPNLKDILKEGLQQCQQSLIELSSFLRIKWKPGQSLPVITEIIPVTIKHVQALYQNIST